MTKKLLIAAVGAVGIGALLFFRGDIRPRDLPSGGFSGGENAASDVLKARTKWSRRIDEIGAERAYQEFKAAYAAVDFGTQHASAHMMGELLYQKKGIGGLAVCDATFSFGCYHSFFGRAISEKGLGFVAELDRACIEKHGPLGTGCEHGIGHGILEYVGHDKLSKALDACTLTAQKNSLFGCTSGVFMEYNLPTIITATTSFPGVRPFNPKNPYEPCNTIVAEQFQKSCYYEIGQWWDKVSNHDYARFGMWCKNIPAVSNRESCFLGLGNIAAPSTGYRVEETLARCREMPDAEGELFCRAGASWSFFASVNYRSSAPLLCEGTPPQNRIHCIEKSDLIGNGEILRLQQQ